MMIDHDDLDRVFDVIAMWGGALFGMILALLPTEQIESDELVQVRGLPEGAVERVEVNRYERNRMNRAMCIAMLGRRCVVCEFDFAREYGSLGADFIVVHHITPVSKLGAGYVINPATDLVPVCPNCHAMLHKKDPPLGIAELRELMRAAETG